MIAMLGDLKGVKSLIKDNKLDILNHRITKINEIFAKAFIIEKKRSKTLKCFTFSDSILAYWDSDYEGCQYAKSFAMLLWKEIEQNNFPYRIFINSGVTFPDSDNISNIISIGEERFKKIFPVSIAIWSIFSAESSSIFPEGVFIGEELVEEKGNMISYTVEPFTFYKIT